MTSTPARSRLLGIVEIEDVRRDAQPARMRLLDDRPVDLGRHLGRGAQIVVDANLDDVGPRRRHARHGLTSLAGRPGGDDVAGHEDTRTVERRHRLLVACLKRRRLFSAEAPHRRDAVTREDAELPQRVCGGVRARAQPVDVGDVGVRGEQAGEHELAGEVGGPRPWRNLHVARSTDGLDSPRTDQDRRVVDRRRPGDAHQAGADKGVRRRCGVLWLG